MSSETPGILALEGDIDLYQAPAVKARLDAFIAQKPARILVDLSRVTYIDSSGLALFVECLQRIAEHGGRLALFGLSESVRHVFEIARLDQVFSIFPDESAARAAN